MTDACEKCGHTAEHLEPHGCLEPVNECRCEQCVDMYAAGGRVLYAELCHCGREGDDD